MNQKEYRDLKINKYNDVEKGERLYRHEKIYDIVKTIENFVNKSFDDDINNRDYIEFYKELSSRLPDSYSKENQKYFAKFIEHYKFAKNSEKNHNSSFRRALYKNFKIEYLNGHYSKIRDVLRKEKTSLDEVQLKRYWWVVSMVFSFKETMINP